MIQLRVEHKSVSAKFITLKTETDQRTRILKLMVIRIRGGVQLSKYKYEKFSYKQTIKTLYLFIISVKVMSRYFIFVKDMVGHARSRRSEKVGGD